MATNLGKKMNSESLNGKNLILWKANQISLHFLLIFVKKKPFQHLPLARKPAFGIH